MPVDEEEPLAVLNDQKYTSKLVIRNQLFEVLIGQKLEHFITELIVL